MIRRWRSSPDTACACACSAARASRPPRSGCWSRGSPFLRDHPDGLTSPGGTRVEIDLADPPLVTPEPEQRFEVRRLQDSDSWVIGRAGMQYRDLIPGRLGGTIIASHIRIPDGGPVPDMVHYHTVGFQLIFCYRGWVRLVYEDQGPPFILEAGDCVIQPPEIRHRVLEASDNLQVIEVGVPAEHITTIDHDGIRPTAASTRTAISAAPASSGIAWGKRSGSHGGSTGSTPVKRASPRQPGVSPASRSQGRTRRPRGLRRDFIHQCDILFAFVMEGCMTLSAEGEADHPLPVMPSPCRRGFGHRFGRSGDPQLLWVTLPGGS
ncbi:MAG: cupin domain-containing protein [Geminicoccaceae bacterium]